MKCQQIRSLCFTTFLQYICFSIISSCLTLIQDEDTDIRTEACNFVTQLLNSKDIIQVQSHITILLDLA